GEPVFSKLSFNISSDGQGMGFILSAIEGEVKDIMLEIDNYKKIEFSDTLLEGETIKYTGGSSAILYNKNWKKIKALNIDPVTLASGEHTVSLDCTFIGDKETKLKLEVRMPEKTIKIISE
ncbi:MAG: hypothetical protein K8R53_11665, partial [Bacteroidales bacterium]|nr:hypothetical protein [Bacteroidales bacterium]